MAGSLLEFHAKVNALFTLAVDQFGKQAESLNPTRNTTRGARFLMSNSPKAGFGHRSTRPKFKLITAPL